MSSGDTLVLSCFALPLVFLMTPGLAFFYGGLVRRKNVDQYNDGLHRHYGMSIVMWVLRLIFPFFRRKPCRNHR